MVPASRYVLISTATRLSSFAARKETNDRGETRREKKIIALERMFTPVIRQIGPYYLHNHGNCVMTVHEHKTLLPYIIQNGFLRSMHPCMQNSDQKTRCTQPAERNCTLIYGAFQSRTNHSIEPFQEFYG